MKMKPSNAWCFSMKILPVHRNHQHVPKRPVWIIVLISLVSFFLICGYIYPSQNSSACYVFSSRGCVAFTDYWLPSLTSREFTDEELASQAFAEEILRTSLPPTNTSKIAFMFLTPGRLPFEWLWDKFFEGHGGKFSVYVHASQQKVVHESRYFINTDIRSDEVVWGQVSMIDAERRLLANALKDPDNYHFVLLSDSCVPLYKFDYVYNYLINTNISYVDSFSDPGPDGNDRYSPHMMPEIEEKDFRKGAQWVTLKRQHALIVIADSLYYGKFKNYCKPGFEGRNCYSDEHYLQTFFTIVDPGGISNWSVTHVDWSEHKWHPRAYRAEDISHELLQNLTSIDESVHETSEATRQVTISPCLWNGVKRPCHLFARKFYPETLDKMMEQFSTYSAAA